MFKKLFFNFLVILFSFVSLQGMYNEQEKEVFLSESHKEESCEHSNYLENNNYLEGCANLTYCLTIPFVGCFSCFQMMLKD